MPSLATMWVVAASLPFAVALTGLVRWHSLRSGVLDIPNERSSHTRPTPRGGGLAIVLVVCLVAAYLWLVEDSIGAGLAVSVIGAGGLIAWVGYLDDKSGLSPATRFVAHAVASVAAVFLIGAQALAAAVLPVLPGWLAILLLVFGVAWVLNLYNFMDGIDGIAGMEAFFAAGGGAVLALAHDTSLRVVPLSAAVAVASLGFLLWNWAPAKIFMGDVGSGFVGFVLAALALASELAGDLSIWTWVILTSLFVGDATATLFRRLLRRERVYAAHRSHAYQYLSRRWKSHSRVTLLYAAINLMLVFPLAWWSVANPRLALPIALGAVATAIGGALVCHAGRAEQPMPVTVA